MAALIRDEAGRVLLVRKRGTAAFMQPGGKRDAGESDVAALARELVEELGCRVSADSAQRSACSIARPRTSRASRCMLPSMRSMSRAQSRRGPRSTQIVWVDPRALPDLPLAPLTRDHVLPLARTL